MPNTFTIAQLSELCKYANDLAQAVAYVEIPNNHEIGLIDFLYYQQRKEEDTPSNGDKLKAIARIHIDVLAKDEVVNIQFITN